MVVAAEGKEQKRPLRPDFGRSHKIRHKWCARVRMWKVALVEFTREEGQEL